MLKNTAPKRSKTAEKRRRITSEGRNTKNDPLHAPSGRLMKHAEKKSRACEPALLRLTAGPRRPLG